MKRILLATTILFSSSFAFADTITIGYTVSNSGKMQRDSNNQANGYKLWAQILNSGGGIKINGKSYTINLVSRDDQSNVDRLQELYTRLIIEDNADFLFSPYSSALSNVAAIISEQYGKPMIVAGASDDQIFMHGNKKLFQIYAPASNYFKGALDIIKEQKPDSRIAMIYEDDTFPKAVVESAREYAKELQLNVRYIDDYQPNTTNFSQYVSKMKYEDVSVLLGGGHYPDGVALSNAVYNAIPIKFLSLLVAPDNSQFASIGGAAKGVSVPVQWSAQVKFKVSYGPIPQEFVNFCRLINNTEPGYHIAGGYAAGIVLQHAIETAKTVDVESVTTALNNTNIDTFFGHIEFSKNPHGIQIGKSIIITQWQNDSSGNLSKQIVWPREAATMPVLWNNTNPLK